MNIRYQQVKGWTTTREMVGLPAENVWDEEVKDVDVQEHYVYVVNHNDLALNGAPAAVCFRFEALPGCGMRLAYVVPWMAMRGASPYGGKRSGDEREWSYCPKELTRKRRYGLNVMQPTEDYDIEDAVYMAMDSMRDGYGNEPSWTPGMVIDMLESIGISEADDAWYNTEGVESE